MTHLPKGAFRRGPPGINRFSIRFYARCLVARTGGWRGIVQHVAKEDFVMHAMTAPFRKPLKRMRLLLDRMSRFRAVFAATSLGYCAVHWLSAHSVSFYALSGALVIGTTAVIVAACLSARSSFPSAWQTDRWHQSWINFTRLPSTPSAIWPCFKRSASLPKTSRRHPCSSGTSAASSSASRSISSELATSRAAT